MTNLVNKERDQRVHKLAPQSLGELWEEAEKLGRIEVDSKFSSKEYSVEIMFTRKSGTRIYAKGVNTDIVFALADAINEAREMGA